MDSRDYYISVPLSVDWETVLDVKRHLESNTTGQVRVWNRRIKYDYSMLRESDCVVFMHEDGSGIYPIGSMPNGCRLEYGDAMKQNKNILVAETTSGTVEIFETYRWHDHLAKVENEKPDLCFRRNDVVSKGYPLPTWDNETSNVILLLA